MKFIIYKYFLSLIISGSSSLLLAQDQIYLQQDEVVFINYGNNLLKNWYYIPSETQFVILKFLSADSTKVDYLPEVVGGIDSLLAKFKYPELAIRAGVEGNVIIEFIVDSNGIVNNNDLFLIKGIGAGCDEVILDAILKQKFSPAIRNNKVIELKMHMKIKFSLSGGIYFKKNYFPRPIHPIAVPKLKISLYPQPDKLHIDSLTD